MTARLSAGLVALSVTGLLLAGCGGSSSTGSAQSHSTPGSPTVTTQAPAHEAANLASASAPAAMVCSKEIRESIATLLNLPKLPQGRATWADHRFTCGYDLAAGHLAMTVQELSSQAAATRYLTKHRASYANTRTITGLPSFGLPAFENATGITGFVKDNFALVVDASHLSGRLGPHGMSRSTLSYSLASDVIACWSE